LSLFDKRLQDHRQQPGADAGNVVAAKSGGFHYKQDGGQWRNTRDGSELFAALSDMVSGPPNRAVQVLLSAG